MTSRRLGGTEGAASCLRRRGCAGKGRHLYPPGRLRDVSRCLPDASVCRDAGAARPSAVGLRPRLISCALLSSGPKSRLAITKFSTQSAAAREGGGGHPAPSFRQLAIRPPEPAAIRGGTCGDHAHAGCCLERSMKVIAAVPPPHGKVWRDRSGGRSRDDCMIQCAHKWSFSSRFGALRRSSQVNCRSEARWGTRGAGDGMTATTGGTQVRLIWGYPDNTSAPSALPRGATSALRQGHSWGYRGNEPIPPPTVGFLSDRVGEAIIAPPGRGGCPTNERNGVICRAWARRRQRRPTLEPLGGALGNLARGDV
jgi:hypothetical protein